MAKTKKQDGAVPTAKKVEMPLAIQTLYKGKRKVFIALFLFLACLAAGPPFGQLGAAYNMPPLYEASALTGANEYLDRIKNYDSDNIDDFKRTGWILTVFTFSVFFLYIAGWIVAKRKYKNLS